MVPNAHLLGFFRRIVRLLATRIKPVFVFDGAPPALKKQTLVERRRARGRADVKVQRLAEKLLLNHVRAMMPQARRARALRASLTRAASRRCCPRRRRWAQRRPRGSLRARGRLRGL